MMGVNVQPVPVPGADKLDGAFARMAKERIGGLVVGADGMLVSHRTHIAELALKQHSHIALCLEVLDALAIPIRDAG
jgi:hypothetical protein